MINGYYDFIYKTCHVFQFVQQRSGNQTHMSGQETPAHCLRQSTD